MGAMTRDTLRRILGRAPGVSTTKGRHDIGKEHHLTFYLGEPGRAMVVGEIAYVVLDEEDFVEAGTHETGTTVYIPYDVIHAVAMRPPKEEADRRAGFA
jgi:hypothetical protein